MLPLAEIYRLSQQLDDAGRSPIADTVATRWGYPPGLARHWRSSASHVFTLPGITANGAFLRMVPAACRSRDRVDAIARLMRTLADRGLAVAHLMPATSGCLVETVATQLGEVHAMMVRTVPGEQITVSELTPARASAWGTALARLHRDGGQAGGLLPGPFAELPRVAEVFPDDPVLAAAAAEIARRLDGFPRDQGRFGTVHGDFELDNLRWADDGVTAYDFDDAARSWFAADIACAVRDLAPVPARTPRAGEAELFAAFLTGYRQVRPLSEQDLGHLPLFAAAHAAGAAVRARLALGTDQAPGIPAQSPPWLDQLDRKLRDYIGRQRAMATAALRSG